MSVWPYPKGIAPRPLPTVDHPLRPDPDISRRPVCKFCGSDKIVRNGSYTRVRTTETVQVALCRTCGRSTFLPLGQRLAYRLTPYAEPCPHCQSIETHRKSEQRRYCKRCSREFLVTENRHRRRETSLEQTPPPAVEARIMFEWCLRTYGPYAPTRLLQLRMEIAVSRQDRDFLRALVGAGELSAPEIENALLFREKVLAEFDRLVEGDMSDRYGRYSYWNELVR
jgi:hypothetical protein